MMRLFPCTVPPYQPVKYDVYLVDNIKAKGCMWVLAPELGTVMPGSEGD